MNKCIRIAITGPESTAKSTLSKKLAKYFNGIFYPEYARLYLDEKDSVEYTFDDVVKIAEGQLEQYREAGMAGREYVFFDTWLVITKVWFQWVYQRYPAWLDEEMDNHPIDLYLLCLPDIDWIPDPLRENGGEERIRLYEAYKKELIARSENFVEIGGQDEKRLKNAIEAIHRFQGK